MKNLIKILFFTMIMSFSFSSDLDKNKKFIFETDLVLRGKVFYLISDFTPYTGMVLDITISNPNCVNREYHLKDGVYHGKYIDWNCYYNYEWILCT